MPKYSKKHHYVPRFILKNFSNNERIFILDKKELKIYPANIKDSFHENNFNTINHSVELENIYAEIENAIAPVIEDVVKKQDISWLKHNDYEYLLLFFIIQTMRNHLARMNIEAMLQKMLKHTLDFSVAQKIIPTPPKKMLEYMKSNGIDKLSDIVNFQIKQEYIKAQAASLLNNLPETVNISMANKNFYLFKNPANNFYISDTCSVMHNSQTFGPYGNIGYAVPFIEMYLPLSPALMLGIIDCRVPIRKDANGKEILEMNTQNVMFFNSLQIMWGNRYIGSNTEDFTFAKKVLKENPKWRDGSDAIIR